MFTIGVDCRLAGKQHAGIGRYIENLVRRLPSITSEVQWKFFFHDQQQASEVLAPLREQTQNVEVILAPFSHYGLEEQLKFPAILNAAKLDLLHVPHFNIPLFYGGKMVVTIHDLLWHEYRGTEVTTLPPWQYWLKYAAYRWVVKQAVQRAHAIIVPTRSIQAAVTRHFPSVDKKIQVTTEGISYQEKQLEHVRQQRTKNIDKIFTDQPRSLLFIGSLYPHKNVRLIVNALSQLPSYELWIVGTRSAFVDSVKKDVNAMHLERQVKFLGYQSDESILKLFEKTFALVQPSFSEGFGLTGIEALAAGVPVMASDIPVFREVYQDSAILFDPHRVEDFLLGLKKIHETHAKKILHSAEKLATTYSWDAMTSQTFTIYQKVLAPNTKVV